jgi:hypothetical protein
MSCHWCRLPVAIVERWENGRLIEGSSIEEDDGITLSSEDPEEEESIDPMSESWSDD